MVDFEYDFCKLKRNAEFIVFGRKFNSSNQE